MTTFSVDPITLEVMRNGFYSIADEMIARAERFSERVAEDTIDAFCVTLEGVSHFLYFTYFDRPVTAIELEIQAEVDKYVVLRTMSGMPDLVDRLFSDVNIDASLPDRYRVANREGRRYARWLESRFARGEGASAIEDARRLYRKPLAQKLDHIARAA